MKDTGAAWLAGIFDGEGSVNLALKPYRANTWKSIGAWMLRISISNTHFPTIEHITELAGGRIGIHVRKEENRRVSYTWQTEAISARKFLEVILPYVVTKRNQVSLAIKGDTLRRDAPRVDRLPGTGKGSKPISNETHVELKNIAQQIKNANGHKLLATNEESIAMHVQAQQDVERLNKKAITGRKKLWNPVYECCIDCGTNERRHQARGMCTRCYQRVVAREYRAKRRQANMPIGHKKKAQS